MRIWQYLVTIVLLTPFTLSAQVKTPNYVLVVHGGVGTITRESMTPQKEAAYRDGLTTALDAGEAILKEGGTALDAVEAAVRALENDSLFNAGKGAVFTAEGTNELDASVMDGSNLAAGAVAGVKTVKNPICAARAVMEYSPHVMLAGAGADSFARQSGCEIVSREYFRTHSRWMNLQKARLADSLRQKQDTGRRSGLRQIENKDWKYGTVGAVALDAHGNLAAATSTGGMTSKKFGRIGDSPIIGAGTYANNNTCAVSCTGWGEYFIRLVVAKSVSDRMELAGESVDQASSKLILELLPALGGDGGLIAVDRNGNIAMPFNTKGMYRGYIKSTGERVVAFYD